MCDFLKDFQFVSVLLENHLLRSRWNQFRTVSSYVRWTQSYFYVFIFNFCFFVTRGAVEDFYYNEAFYFSHHFAKYQPCNFRKDKKVSDLFFYGGAKAPPPLNILFCYRHFQNSWKSYTGHVRSNGPWLDLAFAHDSNAEYSWLDKLLNLISAFLLLLINVLFNFYQIWQYISCIWTCSENAVSKFAMNLVNIDLCFVSDD